MNSHVITTIAPAKIILSGEYSVVYGQPALAMSVNRFATTTINQHSKKNITLNLLNLEYEKTLTSIELKSIYHQIKKHYQDFINGKIKIDEVLKKPFELLLYAIGYCLSNLRLGEPNNIAITINSNIPIGCGMGSSASILVSLLYAIDGFFDLKLNDSEKYKIGRKIENLQHGNSSGLDLYLSIHGGCVMFSQDTIKKRNTPEIPITIVNTGQPKTNTGECINKVKVHLEKNNVLKTFGDLTRSMDIALQKNDIKEVKRYIKENHKLLKNLGIVPKKVDNFIEAVNKKGNAAKISGAGTISGNNAGIVIIIGEYDITDIVKDYGYETIPIKGENNGIQSIQGISTR